MPKPTGSNKQLPPSKTSSSRKLSSTKLQPSATPSPHGAQEAQVSDADEVEAFDFNLQAKKIQRDQVKKQELYH